MFRPLTWPSSGRCVTKNKYTETLQKFVNQCTDVKYCFKNYIVCICWL